MTDKKTEELNEAELDQITGGLSIGDLKPGLTEKVGARFSKATGIRATNKLGGRATTGIRKINKIVAQTGTGEI